MLWAVLSQVMIGFQLSAAESLSHRCNGIYIAEHPDNTPSIFRLLSS